MIRTRCVFLFVYRVKIVTLLSPLLSDIYVSELQNYHIEESVHSGGKTHQFHTITHAYGTATCNLKLINLATVFGIMLWFWSRVE